MVNTHQLLLIYIINIFNTKLLIRHYYKQMACQLYKLTLQFSIRKDEKEKFNITTVVSAIY